MTLLYSKSLMNVYTPDRQGNGIKTSFGKDLVLLSCPVSEKHSVSWGWAGGVPITPRDGHVRNTGQFSAELEDSIHLQTVGEPSLKVSGGPK